MSTDQKDVKTWTLKEGRDKQWISSGPWIGRGKTVEVVPLSDYADLQSKVEMLEKANANCISLYLHELRINDLERTIALLHEHKVQDQAEIAKLREALEEAREGVSSHLDNLQHYFENKCLPTLEEVNQFSEVDSRLALVICKYKALAQGGGNV